MLLRTRISSSALAALALGLAWSSAASGQTTPGPAAQVFGPAQATGPVSQSADLSVSIAEAYETNAVGGSSSSGAPAVLLASGVYSTLKADTDYIRNSEHLKLAASAGSNLRYYPDLKEVLAINNYVGGAVTSDFHRTTVAVNQTLAYSPSYLYSLFPGATTPVPGLVGTGGANYVLSTVRSYTDETTGTVSERLTSRAAIIFDGGYRSTNFTSAVSALNVNSHDLAGHFAYRFNRTGTFRTGYIYREARYASGFRATERGVEAGLDLDRQLSRTRRATVRFNVGSTLVDAPAQAAAGGASRLPRQYGVIGNGAVWYDFARTWHVQGSYQRDVRFVEGFSTPLTSNGYHAEMGGFINRRMDFLAVGGYSRGQATFIVNASSFDTRTVDVRVRRALGKQWAAFVEYLYYYYRFDQGMLITPIFDPRLNRNGLQVGLTLWTGVRRK